MYTIIEVDDLSLFEINKYTWQILGFVKYYHSRSYKNVGLWRFPMIMTDVEEFTKYSIGDIQR